MANPVVSPYLIVDGDITMILTRNEDHKETVSVQLVADGAFDGTSSTGRLLQSNILDLPIADWNPLPEDPLVLIVGSNLLQTTSFVCRFLVLFFFDRSLSIRRKGR